VAAHLIRGPIVIGWSKWRWWPMMGRGRPGLNHRMRGCLRAGAALPAQRMEPASRNREVFGFGRSTASPVPDHPATSLPMPVPSNAEERAHALPPSLGARKSRYAPPDEPEARPVVPFASGHGARCLSSPGEFRTVPPPPPPQPCALPRSGTLSRGLSGTVEGSLPPPPQQLGPGAEPGGRGLEPYSRISRNDATASVCLPKMPSNPFVFPRRPNPHFSRRLAGFHAGVF